MARTETGAALTRQHRQRQIALRAEMVREFMQIWPVWNAADPRSFDRLVDATIPLVEMRNRTSAGIASEYYRAFRTAEGVGGEATPRLAARPDRDQVAASLYATGQAQVRRSVSAGFSAQAAQQTALVTLTGAATRHVLAGGRETITASASADEGALGWMQVTAANPCAFCAMLAARGPVYTEASAAPPDPVTGLRVPQVVGRRGGRARGARAVGQSYHDNCACSLEPFYEGSTMPADSQRYREMWNEAQRRAGDDPEWASAGTSNDALNNFRRMLGNN